MELGVWMLNVHALGSKEMLRAASQVIKQSSIKPFLIGVTVLTSLDDKSLKLVGFNKFAEDQVLLLAELCKQEGLDGVVCSPKEVSNKRKKLGDDFLLVTPGIRSNEMNKGDQKRTSSVELDLIPGVTKRKSSPSFFLLLLTSFGEQTTPSNPSCLQSSAKRRTWSSANLLKPTSFRLLSSKLVSTVTPIRKGLIEDCLITCEAALNISLLPNA
jgi:hypothetical protein